MHYYQRNIGDYARDTGHLTVLEHGLYALMLDWYYLNERPITEFDLKRISRGMVDEAKVILVEFFKETADGWVHSYADRLIAEYHGKAEQNRLNGRRGGRPRAEKNPEITQSVSSGLPDGSQEEPGRIPTVTLTNNQEPRTNNQKIKSTVQQAARFGDFWAVYPNKKGKQEAEKRWKRDGLDGLADQIIGHVLLMTAQDDGWLRGYAPMGSTYLNQARWTDVPQPAPRERQPPVSKTMQSIMKLEVMKNELDGSGNNAGVPAATLPWPGASTLGGSSGRNGHGLANGFVPQPGVGSSIGRPALPGSLPSDDGYPD